MRAWRALRAASVATSLLDANEVMAEYEARDLILMLRAVQTHGAHADSFRLASSVWPTLAPHWNNEQQCDAVRDLTSKHSSLFAEVEDVPGCSSSRWRLTAEGHAELVLASIGDMKEDG